MRRPSSKDKTLGARVSRPHLIAAIVLSVAMAASSDPAIAGHFKAPPIPVESRGSMKEIYDDDAEAKIKLSDLKSTEHLYALGPLSKLRGEIIIWDSIPYESRVNKGQIQVKSDWEESAAFLVWSSVRKWKKIEIPTSVRSLQSFEMWLNSMSNMEAAPLRREYPFLIKGHFGRIVWHVINAKQDSKAITPQNHQDQKFHGQSTDVKAEMLGFFAPGQQGLFIPKGRATHLHVKVGDQFVAHVEDFDPFGDYGIKLYVPSP